MPACSVRLAEPSDAGAIAEFNRAMAWETEHLAFDIDRLGALVHDLSGGEFPNYAQGMLDCPVR